MNMARKSPAQVLEKPVVEEESAPAIAVSTEAEVSATVIEATVPSAELNQPDTQPQPSDDVRLKFEVEVDAFDSKLSTALLAVPLNPIVFSACLQP